MISRIRCYTLEILVYRSYAIPNVTKHKTDSGRKSGYYAPILSGKEDHGLWSLSIYSEALCEITASARHAGKLIRFDER